ncbi:MAG: hypothetical protein AAFR38_06125 [Planctomycetota bacterium]
MIGGDRAVGFASACRLRVTHSTTGSLAASRLAARCVRAVRWDLGESIPAEAGATPTPRDHARSMLALAPDEIAIAAFSARPGTVDASMIVFLLGALELAGHRLAAVVPADSLHGGSAARLAREVGLRMRIVGHALPLSAVMSGLDLLLEDFAARETLRPRVDGPLRRLAERLGLRIVAARRPVSLDGLTPPPLDLRAAVGEAHAALSAR